MPADVEKLGHARALYEARRAPEAIQIVEELLKKESQNADYLINLALYLRAVGKFEESLKALEHVPHDIPGYAMLMGWHLLRQGKFLEGMRMREPESGINRIDKRYPFPPQKRLQAGTPIRDKKIFFALEGGNGDEIAYVRFVQTLKKLSAQVIVGTSSELSSIIARTQGVKEVYPVEAISHDQYEYYLPAMSVIPFLKIGNPSGEITIPYITPDPARTAHWQSIIAGAAQGKLKIGIQWQGNMEFEHVEFKSIPALLFAQFSEIGQLFSLQRPETVGENRFPTEIPIVETQNGPSNWEDTLAVISEMDYIIAGDTTITHMAGASGKKTLLLLPHAPHPYWADLREQSTWYPSVRVFRQPQYNDWAGAARNAFNFLCSEI